MAKYRIEHLDLELIQEFEAQSEKEAIDFVEKRREREGTPSSVFHFLDRVEGNNTVFVAQFPDKQRVARATS